MDGFGDLKNAAHPQFPLIHSCETAANYANNLVVSEWRIPVALACQK